MVIEAFKYEDTFTDDGKNGRSITIFPEGEVQTTLETPEEPKPSKPKKKKTYSQKWAEYNLAQTQEKKMSLKILDGIVNSLKIKTICKKTGRPPTQADDMIKACCIKVFNHFSARRTMYELEIANALHYIDTIPHFNSLINYMNDPAMTPYLYELVDKTAKVLAPFEKKFAVDSTGISTFNKDKWLKVRLEHKKHREYKKLHVACGVLTNIIVSVKITDGNEADSPQFRELINKISKSFKIKEISADAGYLSKENTQAVEEIGAQPYIMVKSNTKFSSKGLGSWGRMLTKLEENKTLFDKHYHKRSNVETTFSMIKRKFNPYVRSKKDKAQENEILCLVICHNISVLVHAFFELNIDLSCLE